MSATNNAVPGFGAKLKTPEFYQAVNSILAVLRPVASLRVMADALNRAGLTTASGLEWNRLRVSNYLRTSAN